MICTGLDGRIFLRRVMHQGRWTGEVEQPMVDQGKLHFVDADGKGNFVVSRPPPGDINGKRTRYATVHEAGQTVRCGGVMSDRRYHAAKLHIVRVVEIVDADGIDGFFVEPLFSTPAKHRLHKPNPAR
jgi:hypothetical protein